MVDVLVEMHLLNARGRIMNRPLEGARDSIFTRYGIDSTAYADAIGYYARHTEEYADVYGRVIDELSAEQTPITGPDSVLAQPAPMPPSR